MATARAYHTATLLPNGQVLVAGGYNGSCLLASAELYDPATGTWTATGSMATAREQPHGDVAAEWAGAGGRRHVTTSRYGRQRGTIRSGDRDMDGDRQHGHWTRIAHGDVAAEWAGAGGRRLTSQLASAELYDPATGVWTATGSMTTGRYAHTATLLPDRAGAGGRRRHHTVTPLSQRGTI